MKKIILIAACFVLMAGYKSDAQVSVNLQVGSPVMTTTWWSTDDSYYYIPEYGVYYNVNRRVYVYPAEGRWVYAPALPPAYGTYKLVPGSYYTVHAKAPFRNHGYYQSTYPKPPRQHQDNGKHKGQVEHENHGHGKH